MNSNYFESEEALESFLWAHYGTADLLHASHPEAQKVGDQSLILSLSRCSLFS